MSYAHIKLLRAFNFIPQKLANPQIFRSINAIGSVFLASVVSNLLFLTKKRDPDKESAKSPIAWDQSKLIHTTINICLFPPLFFFYGLYYTDVLSALSVLLAYQIYLKKTNSWMSISAGLLSLLFRQTNIFWVFLFLGGLAFCRAIPEGRAGFELNEHEFFDVIQCSWQNGCCYDPPISQANFEGRICNSVSAYHC